MQDSVGAQIAPGDIVTARKQLDAIFPDGGGCRITRGSTGIVENLIDAQLVQVGFEGNDGTTISVHADRARLCITA